LDTKAVIACMAYVDLNPLRANMCDVPEADPFSSLYYRCNAITQENFTSSPLPTGLIDLQQLDQNGRATFLPVNTHEYIDLLDAAARCPHPRKKGVMSAFIKPVLERLGISKSAWVDLEQSFKCDFHVLVGSGNAILHACESLGKKTAWGRRACQDFFNDSPG
jgi:hypothetical protein